MMPNKVFRAGAKGALLDEYEKVIGDFKQVIADIDEAELLSLLHHDADDADSQSIQAILTHVVRSGYAYAIYIRRLQDADVQDPKPVPHKTAIDYQPDLDAVLAYMEETLSVFTDAEIDAFDKSKMMISSWGQAYNIEQMMEHSIVHILRHRRQLEKLKMNLRR